MGMKICPFTRFGYANFFHEQMWERDKEIRKKFLKEAVPLIKSCMTGASNQEIEEQIKFGWNEQEIKTQLGILFYAICVIIIKTGTMMDKILKI